MIDLVLAFSLFESFLPARCAMKFHRPPTESFAQQHPRTPLAGVLNPNLTLLPVETARLDATPAELNKLGGEPTLIARPDANLTRTRGSTAPAVPNK